MVMMRSFKVVRPFCMQTSCEGLLMKNVEIVGERKHEREHQQEQEQGSYVSGVFFSQRLTVKLVFLGDRKGNTTFHKHHIILSPYLQAEEILYTNENRRSAWEWIRSNSNLN